MDQLLLTPVTSLLIAANIIASLFALSNGPFMAKNLFHVGPILEQKEWHRMITSGFLHGGFLHFLRKRFKKLNGLVNVHNQSYDLVWKAF